MIDRLTRGSLLALAVVIAPAVLSGQAQARVRAAADIASTLPLGDTERIADPAITGTIKLQWLSRQEHWIVGLVGGQVIEPHRATDNPTLTGTIVGGELAYVFAPKDWGTRPYVGIMGGYSQMGLRGGDAQFDPPTETTSAGGYFIIPEAGLTVPLTESFGLRFDFRYQYLRSFKEMLIANIHTYTSQTFGLGGGIMVTF
jgi:hypothetical protein